MKLVLSKNRAIDFRVSTLPTLHGEKICMRILDPTSATLGIDALGYDPDQKEALLNAISRPYGMVLVTGPTGSGKTVSLYTCLNLLNKPDINISTAEDPAEINLAGINQVNVNEKAGLTFPIALKAFDRLFWACGDDTDPVDEAWLHARDSKLVQDFARFLHWFLCNCHNNRPRI